MKKSVYLSSLLVACLSLFPMAARAQAPVVTTDPVNDTLCTSDTAYFHVAYTGATPLTFMWQYSNDAGATWDTVHDGGSYFWATNDTLGVASSLMLNGFEYRCIVTNTDGADTSEAGMLVVDTAFAGVISGGSAVCVGGTMSLSSTVSGGAWSNVHHDIDTTDITNGMVTGRAFGFDTVHYSITNTCGTSTSWAAIRVDTTVTSMPITGPSTVCVGNMITLMNANVLGTGSWSVTNTNASISMTGVLTGLAAGNDTVIYNFANACNAVSSEYAVTVESPLTAGTVTGASAVCAGSWTHMTSSVTGGMWISSNTAVAIVSSAGDVTGISHGTSVISYYRSNSCGASYTTVNISVDSTAGMIWGNDSVGIDSMLTLTNSVSGGMWTSADESIATVGSLTGVVTGVASGVTNITYMVTNTCGTSYAITAMNVGPLPSAGTLSGPDSVCIGTTITEASTVADGTWRSKYDTVATVDPSTGIVTGVSNGIDTIYYTVTTAFGSKTVKKFVYVNDVPNVIINGPATVSLGGSYAVMARPAGGTWNTDNWAATHITSVVNISDSGYVKTIANFGVIDTGTAIFTYTVTNMCGTTTKTFETGYHVETSVANVGGNNNSLEIFPNPAQESVNVKIGSLKSETVTVVLTNVTGEKVATYEVKTNAATNLTLNQPAGVYMLTAVTSDGVKHNARISITK